jgi:Response regulator containing CheY-like receiver, AAA-type ATPase, and DNA-binding domains
VQNEEEMLPVVWIVDDDASIRWVLETALEDKPYALKVFDSPLLALKSFEQAPPTVIISDVRMPDMDGLTFMEAIHEKDKNIPVIIMTAHADLDTAVKSYQSKAFEYLPKPFDLDEAIGLIDRAIKRKLSGGIKSSRRKKAAGQAAAQYHRGGAGHAGSLPHSRARVAAGCDGADQRRNRYR